MDKFIISLWVGWRLALVVVAGIGMVILPFKPSFPYAETLLLPHGSPLFWSWANFDGVHYIGIAEKSYFAQFTQAFFPFYPLLIRTFNSLTGSSILSGLLISHLSFLAALIMGFKLFKLDLKPHQAKTALLFLLMFPTSF